MTTKSFTQSEAKGPIKLPASGIEVTLDPETYPNGRFACLHDPKAIPSNSGSLSVDMRETEP